MIEAFALPGLEDVWQIPDVVTPLQFFDDEKFPSSIHDTCENVMEAYAIRCSDSANSSGSLLF